MLNNCILSGNLGADPEVFYSSDGDAIAIIEKGQLKLKKEWVDVHEIIYQAVNKLKLQIEDKGGKMYTDLQAENVKIKADRMHLTNVIINLLENRTINAQF